MTEKALASRSTAGKTAGGCVNRSFCMGGVVDLLITHAATCRASPRRLADGGSPSRSTRSNEEEPRTRARDSARNPRICTYILLRGLHLKWTPAAPAKLWRTVKSWILQKEGVNNVQ